MRERMSAPRPANRRSRADDRFARKQQPAATGPGVAIGSAATRGRAIAITRQKRGRWRVRARSACQPPVSTASSRDDVRSPTRSFAAWQLDNERDRPSSRFPCLGSFSSCPFEVQGKHELFRDLVFAEARPSWGVRAPGAAARDPLLEGTCRLRSAVYGKLLSLSAATQEPIQTDGASAHVEPDEYAARKQFAATGV